MAENLKNQNYWLFVSFDSGLGLRLEINKKKSYKLVIKGYLISVYQCEFLTYFSFFDSLSLKKIKKIIKIIEKKNTID